MNVEGRIQAMGSAAERVEKMGAVDRTDYFSISSLALRDIVESKRKMTPFDINLEPVPKALLLDDPRCRLFVDSE
jgi:hypothetical protein